MTNIKVTAILLETAGWTQAQIDRYYKLLGRKQTHGLSALTVSDRRFYHSATVACTQAQTAIDTAIREGQTRRVSGKQPVETKLHYRWLQAELFAFAQLADLLPGEEMSGAIIKAEYLRALEIYQPVLDQVDTAYRRNWNPIEGELTDLAKGIGRCFRYDVDTHTDILKGQFEDNWNGAWDVRNESLWSTGAGLSGEDALEYRAIVRATVEEFVRSFPSVRATVAA